MASFNISKGLEASLPSTKTDGKMYFCTDTGNIYIDYKDGNNILRKLVNKQILDAKQDAITGAASTITNSNLTANRVLLSNSSGKVAASAVTDMELSYLDGVTSAIQTQLDNRIPFDNTNYTSLSSGDDLNNFKTSGIYISANSTTTSGIINAPTTGSGFKLFVIDGYISGRVSQFVTTNNNNLFTRQFNGTSWGDWDTLATKAGLDKKQATVTGAATTITSSNLTASRALVSNSSGKVAVSTVTSTELGYLDGVTSNVQTQLDDKAPSSHTHTEYMTSNNPTGTGSFSLNRKAGTTIGSNSFAAGENVTSSGITTIAFGRNTTASGLYSFAEGDGTTASAWGSHAEGKSTKASQYYSHAEGKETVASGDSSHAEGDNTEASGSASHAEGKNTMATGTASHAAGYRTQAKNYQYVIGKWNNASTAAITSMTDTTATAGLFIVGIGTSNIARANGFRINPAGNAYGVGAFGTSGADYAEYFEWFDGNPNNEDRRGRFVTLDGNKIRYATAEDDYILGIISAEPTVVGDIQSEMWHNMYLKDIYGNKLVEVVEVEESIDENDKIIPAHTERRWVLNPDYDPEMKYISREERPEWNAVGIVGKLVAVDDGTCQVNGYCYPNIDGVATVSKEKTAYRVIERLDDTHIRIFIK